MKVKRIVKFNIKKSHIDYKYIKTQLIESKEIYNFANYVLRQLYFKNSNKHKYSLNFIEEYPTLKELFLEYIDENKQFSTIFYKIICEFSKLKQYSINLKIVQNIVDKLKNDWTSYWKLLKMKKNKTYDKKINIPRYKKKYNLVEYNNQVISKKKLKLGYIGTDKMEQGIKIVNRHKELDCKCFRIYNKNDKILCELIYEKEIEEIENYIKSTGFFRNKAKNIKKCSQQLLEKYHGEIPQDMDKLTELAGVGRKTANVVRGEVWGLADGITVDTHVKRITNLIGLVKSEDPIKIEQELMKIVPKKSWIVFSHYLILHGRVTCIARRPQCKNCEISDCCNYGKIKLLKEN